LSPLGEGGRRGAFDAAGAQVLTGLVDRRVYLGSAVHVVVRLSNGALVTIGTSGHAPAEGFSHGDPVTVTLPPEALRLLP
jgi:hypothetical protein